MRGGSQVTQQGLNFSGVPVTVETPLSEQEVRECGLAYIKTFVEDWHYSHSVFGITGRRFFCVTVRDELVGAAIFGIPAGMGVSEKYDPDGLGLLELRRFVMVDDLPKNSESRCLGAMFRTLKASGVGIILSYADPNHGHVGTIYKATGFEYRGTTDARKHVRWRGRLYPDRNIHQVNFPYHLELRQALADGTATLENVPGKHVYTKVLARRTC